MVLLPAVTVSPLAAAPALAAVQFDSQHGIVATSERVRAGGRLGVAINSYGIGDRWQRAAWRDRVHTNARDQKCNGICAGTIVGIDDRLSERATTAVGYVGHGKSESLRDCADKPECDN